MAILKLAPAYMDYLWGGNQLVTKFHKPFDGDILAESWELSCHPSGPSTIVNGEYAGKTLREYIDISGKQVLGKHCEAFEDFPILVKLIDAKGSLSIQVHPDDEYALEHEGQYGKTEMWYIVDCEKDSFIYYGFNRDVTKEEFKTRIQNNTLLEVLNKVPVQPGDTIFIDSKTLHAIGENILIAEIQQNSNVTYRIYDYGRKDADGNERELHIDKAVEVTDLKKMKRGKNFTPHLGQCKYFTVDRIVLDGKITKKMSGTVNDDSFVSYLFLDGEGVISNQEDTVAFKKGDSIMLTAGSGDYTVKGQCMALVTYI